MQREKAEAVIVYAVVDDALSPTSRSASSSTCSSEALIPVPQGSAARAQAPRRYCA
jgi:hypothetical protein